MNTLLKNKFLLYALIFLCILNLAKDAVLRPIIVKKSSEIIGAKVEINKFALSLLLGQMHIKGLAVHNPPGFSPEVKILVIPEVLVRINLWKTLWGRLHFSKVRLSLEEVTLIRNEEGKLNIDSLKVIEDAKEKKKPQSKDVKNGLEDIKFHVKRLEFDVGRVIYKDFSKPGKPVIQVYNVNLKNRVVQNVDSPSGLITAVLIEALKPTAIRSAGMFAATTIMGAGFLPAAAIGVVVAKDDASVEFKHSFGKVYEASLSLVKELGKIKRFDKQKGQIFADINGCNVVFTVTKIGLFSSKVKVSARKFLLAKPQIAAGILYQLAEKLK